MGTSTTLDGVSSATEMVVSLFPKIIESNNGIITIIIVIIMLYLMRFFYLKKSTKGKQYIADKNNYKYQDLVVNYDDITSDIESKVNCNNIVNDDKNIKSNVDDRLLVVDNNMHYECRFTLNRPFLLLGASESFINLIGCNTFDELKNRYIHYNNFLNPNTTTTTDNITFRDIFTISNIDYNDLIENINIYYTNESNNITIMNDIELILKSEVLGVNIKIICDIIINDNNLLVGFNIVTVTPRVNISIDNSNSVIYKNLMHNLTIDMPHPFIIIDQNGIKFLNKSACDWFNIPYKNIETIQNSNINIDTIGDFFNLIENGLSNTIYDLLRNDDYFEFYKECIINLKDNLDNNNLKLVNAPKEILIHCIPFRTENGKELMINIYNSVMFHKFIKDSKYNTDTSQTVIDRNNSKVSKFIDDIVSYNEAFSTFFKNTEMVSFARINIINNDIIMHNKSFDNLLKHDKYKERYISIIDYIIKEYDKNNTIDEINYYSYDINYKDRETKIVYTYFDNYVDVVILEKTVRKFLSNNSIDLLYNFYETSDLPIVIVDKNANIIRSNTVFLNNFINIDKNDLKQITDSNFNLLDIVPEKEHKKVKRAISEAIKYNSYNLNDTIILNTMKSNTDSIDNKIKASKLSCIKTYGKINDNEFITITIFPENF